MHRVGFYTRSRSRKNDSFPSRMPVRFSFLEKPANSTEMSRHRSQRAHHGSKMATQPSQSFLAIYRSTLRLFPSTNVSVERCSLPRWRSFDVFRSGSVRTITLQCWQVHDTNWRKTFGPTITRLQTRVLQGNRLALAEDLRARLPTIPVQGRTLRLAFCQATCLAPGHETDTDFITLCQRFFDKFWSDSTNLQIFADLRANIRATWRRTLE